MYIICAMFFAQVWVWECAQPLGIGCPTSRAQASTEPSPKAKRTVDKKEDMEEEKSQHEKKSGPPLKKAKKEQDEKPDAKDTQSIGERRRNWTRCTRP